MNYEKFLNQVMEDLGSYLPHHHGPMEIQKVDIEKIGAPSYRGLSIGKEGTALRMTMNLESYYRRVEAGFPYPDIIAGIADKVDQELQKMPSIDPESLSSYSNIRRHLVMELVGTKANRAMLQNVPHKEVEDMSVVYRIKVDIGRDGNATTLVTNRMLNAFGITKEQLHADALESAPAASPATLRRMGDVLGEMIGMESEDLIPSDQSQLYVASTKENYHGAACILYPGFLEMAKKVVGDQFFIIPSSVHECLLFPDNGLMSTSELKAMVTAINADVVQPEEVLTNNVYHYDGDERIFEQAEAYDARQVSGLDEKKPSLLKNLKDLEKACEEKPIPEPRSGKNEMSL